MAKNTENKELDAASRETSSQRILLEEYRLLQSRFLSLRDEGINRLNFFITVASLSIGSILVFGAGNKGIPTEYFKIALVIVSIVLSIVNYDICKFLVSRDIVTDKYERGLARIRNYFVKLEPDIKDRFVTKIMDTPTNYLIKKNSGMQRTAQVLEGFLLGLAATILSTFLILDTLVDILIGCGMAVIVFVVLEVLARTRYNQALKRIEDEIKSS